VIGISEIAPAGGGPSESDGRTVALEARRSIRSERVDIEAPASHSRRVAPIADRWRAPCDTSRPGIEVIEIGHVLHEFAFVMQPLKLKGATGSTVAPMAIR
jgi:hypothetical protein